MESFMLFDTLCNLGEIPQKIEKKMRPLYEETYGAVVNDFSVSQLDKHSIVMTWKRTLSLPKNKQLIGVLDAELITGWTVSGTKPLAFTNIRPTKNKTGTVLTRSFIKRYKMMMKKNYGLNYNRYDISVSATDSELILTIKFLPYIGVVYRYIYIGGGKYQGWSYIGETVNDVNDDTDIIMNKGIMRAPELAKNTYVKIYLSGVNNETLSNSNLKANFDFSQMATTGTLELKIGGNILTLLDKDVSKFENKRLPDYCFSKLFSNNRGIYDASQLELTPKLSSIGLYMGMFQSCTTLVTSPQKIYLTDMSTDCCRTMFYKCSSLVNIPETWCPNVTELGYYVYNSSGSKTWEMAVSCFMSCFRETAIKKLPQLPATKLANTCYGYMFAGCKGLTTQEGWYLPCESFNISQTKGCYNYMFTDCTNLVEMYTKQSNISTDYNFKWLYNINTKGTLFMNRDSTQTSFEWTVKPENWTVSKVL